MGNLFYNKLVRTNTQIKADKARRFAEGAADAAQMAIMKMEGEKRAIEEAIAAGSDISTSNDRNALNALEAFDANSWFSTLAANRLQLKIINEKLEVLHDIRTEFFEEDAGDVAVADREQADD